MFQMGRWRWRRRAWSSAPWGQERCLESWLFCTTAPGLLLSRVSLHRHSVHLLPRWQIISRVLTQIHASTHIHWNLFACSRGLGVFLLPAVIPLLKYRQVSHCHDMNECLEHSNSIVPCLQWNISSGFFFTILQWSFLWSRWSEMSGFTEPALSCVKAPAMKDAQGVSRWSIRLVIEISV